MSVLAIHKHEHRAKAPAKSDRKLTKDLQRFGGPRDLIAQTNARQWCANIISHTWPGPSVEAIADKAAGPLLTSSRTVRRILTDKDTTRFDGGILARAQAYCLMLRQTDPATLIPRGHP